VLGSGCAIDNEPEVISDLLRAFNLVLGQLRHLRQSLQSEKRLRIAAHQLRRYINYQLIDQTRLKEGRAKGGSGFD
jgi:hypothetical protein